MVEEYFHEKNTTLFTELYVQTQKEEKGDVCGHAITLKYRSERSGIISSGPALLLSNRA